MTMRSLITDAKNTWCPGCGNFMIQFALRNLLQSLSQEGLSLDSIVLVTGIGCHAKIADYMNINSFYSIHGRTIPVATGIKLANPDLTVIACAGDGDAYAEGLDHLIFAAKRNIDITLLVHNNRVYGLTTGQYTPTSPFGFKGRSTPGGSIEEPFNPLELVLASGGTFIARESSLMMDGLQESMMEAVRHRGFSFMDILQICATYFNMTDYYRERIYRLGDHDPADFDEACRRMREWDYSSDAPIGLGTFYREEKDTFDARLSSKKRTGSNREQEIQKILDLKA
jgi:2-oxoglutarate ferredoxin oxidoreductase subunit beta